MSANTGLIPLTSVLWERLSKFKYLNKTQRRRKNHGERENIYFMLVEYLIYKSLLHISYIWICHVSTFSWMFDLSVHQKSLFTPSCRYTKPVWHLFLQNVLKFVWVLPYSGEVKSDGCCQFIASFSTIMHLPHYKKKVQEWCEEHDKSSRSGFVLQISQISIWDVLDQQIWPMEAIAACMN